MIVKKPDGYYVKSESGKNLGGPYDTKDKAEKRLQQVEYFKHRSNENTRRNNMELLEKIDLYLGEDHCEEEEESTEYQKFFKEALKKFGVSSPAELEGDKKKEFFDYVDKNYKAKHETD